MKKYRVEIEQTVRWSIEVEAETEADARGIGWTRSRAIAPEVHQQDIRAICDAELPTVEDIQRIYRETQ